MAAAPLLVPRRLLPQVLARRPALRQRLRGRLLPQDAARRPALRQRLRGRLLPQDVSAFPRKPVRALVYLRTCGNLGRTMPALSAEAVSHNPAPLAPVRGGEGL